MMRREGIKEAFYKIIYALAAFVMVYYAFRLLFVGMLHIRDIVLCGVNVTVMVLIGTVPRVSLIDDSEEKRRAVRRALGLLFAFYIIGLIGTLFVGRADGDMTLAARRAYQAENWKTQVNLTPLNTVKRYVKALSRGVIPGVSLVNLIGNVVLMAPMAVLAPLIWRGLRKAWRFILLTFFVLVGIEALQLLLCLGVCDVDDVLLNLLGAVAVYYCMRLPFIKRLLVRLYILPPDETEHLSSTQ